MYSLDDFFAFEGKDLLSWTLWNTWNQEHKGAQPPKAEAFLSKHFNPLDMKGETTIIDVADPDPQNFTIRFRHETTYGRLGQELVDRRICDYPCQLHARAAMTEYLITRETRQPICHEIDQAMLGISRRYRRIVLPLTGSGKSVTQLLVCSRSLRPAIELPKTVRAI
jgi:hypothetical protein